MLHLETRFFAHVWEHGVRAGLLGKLVLQEGWQQLTGPPLHSTKPSPQQEPPAHAGSRGSPSSTAQSTLCPRTGRRKARYFP